MARDFNLSCDALVRAVKLAADPACPAFIPYVGWPVDNARWWVKFVLSEARASGRYPTTDQIEAELQRAA